MSDKQAVIAQKGPYAVQVEAGKSYWWCACGKSATQPFCDGSHKGSEFSPSSTRPRNRKRCIFAAASTAPTACCATVPIRNSETGLMWPVTGATAIPGAPGCAGLFVIPLRKAGAGVHMMRANMLRIGCR